MSEPKPTQEHLIKEIERYSNLILDHRSGGNEEIVNCLSKILDKLKKDYEECKKGGE